MNKMIDWLANRKMVNIAIILIYFVMVVLPHKAFGTFINNSVKGAGFTRAQYNFAVLCIFSAVILIVALIFLRNTIKSDNRWKQWGYLAATLLFASLIIRFLFVINIEVIHFPQYALFAMLLFPLLRNYNHTLWWGTVFGAIDEGYQYFYLAPLDTGYYDFNDVVTNLVGVALGLIILRSTGVKNDPAIKLWPSRAAYALIGVIVLIGVLYLTKVWTFYPEGGGLFPIINKRAEGFWSEVPPQVIYHVVQPLEGVIMLLFLGFFYSKIED